MEIKAAQVAELRKKTGCGMMECKKALVEANGDMDAAVKVLRERGLAVAAKKQDRIAADGLVDIKTTGDVTAMIEVNSETDFVAKNDSFRAFVSNLLDVVIANKPADVAALLACNYEGDLTVEDKIKELTFTIGEKLSVRRFVIVEGTTSTYIHGHGSIGVVISFEADDAAKNNAGFAEFAKNIALQVGAYPTEFLSRESVPAAKIAEEKEIRLTQMKNDPKFANKPDAMLENIVNGKMGKYFEENCLLEQAYVKDDSLSVAKYVANTAKEFGGSIAVKAFFRYEKGEGMEKREENFAEEINKMVNG